MKTIVAIYTGKGLADPLGERIKNTLTNYRLISIIDENIIGECVKNGGMTEEIERRLHSYYRSAEEMGADLILNTCSSVGKAVYSAREFLTVPILRIDEPFAQKAVREYSKIGVVATLETTLKPTMDLIYAEAEKASKAVTAVNGLAQGAYDALIGGDPEKHDRLIEETVLSLQQEVEVILLAQASMARMEERLNQISKVPVIASPQIALDYITENY